MLVTLYVLKYCNGQAQYSVLINFPHIRILTVLGSRSLGQSRTDFLRAFSVFACLNPVFCEILKFFSADIDSTPV